MSDCDRIACVPLYGPLWGGWSADGHSPRSEYSFVLASMGPCLPPTQFSGTCPRYVRCDERSRIGSPAPGYIWHMRVECDIRTSTCPVYVPSVSRVRCCAAMCVALTAVALVRGARVACVPSLVSGVELPSWSPRGSGRRKHRPLPVRAVHALRGRHRSAPSPPCLIMMRAARPLSLRGDLRGRGDCGWVVGGLDLQ